MIKGALFDMDGVLVDNTAAHTEAFAIFCERYGVTEWREKLAQSYGMGNDDILRRLLPAATIRDHGVAALTDEKEAIYRELYAPQMQPVAGLRELLEQLHTAGIRCAVGSSGPADNVRMVLEGCHIADYFEFRVSGDRVTHCKPDPEIYLTAAAGIELSPAECVVFEDAPAGIESARRAGVGRIVTLATSFSSDELREIAPERIIHDFTEIADLKDLLK
ncbi:MAG: HAD family phosphatase [Alistipes sp.]